MPLYSAFGGCLDSQLTIPDLPPSAATSVDWRLTRSDDGAPEVPLQQLGEHTVGRWTYRLFRTPAGLRLEFADWYLFDIERGGSEIVWYAHEKSVPESVRALVVGPVLALAHHLSGSLCLHGSAVAVEGQGVAFLAAKYHGKSTLGLALALAGAHHLSDDTLVVDLQTPARLRPGVHSVRLWNDSAARLGAADLDCVIVDGVKNTLTELPQRLLQRGPVPLAAVYLLCPVPAGDGVPAVERTVLTPATAAAALSHHAKLPQPLLGPRESAPQFLRAASLARTVPVFELRVARDFDRLPEVVDTILGWHGAERRTPAGVLATA